MMKTKLFLLATAFSVPVLTEAQVSIQDVGGWFESGYVTFTPIDEAASYSVYYKTAESEYQKIDDQLVRNYEFQNRTCRQHGRRTDRPLCRNSIIHRQGTRPYGLCLFQRKNTGGIYCRREVKTQHRSIVPHRKKQKYTLDGRCHEFKRSKNDLHRIAGNTQRI